jgi:hypothetical protein
MAITTLDKLIEGFLPPEDFFKAGTTFEAVGVWHSYFYLAGRPGAAVAPTPGLGGAALTSYAGQIPFPAAVGGKNIYLARFSLTPVIAGMGMLADRLWHNSGITMTTTTGQTVNSVAWPARDRNGSTNGAGVLVGLEVSSATGNGGAITNTTLTYTNQDGTGSRTGTIASFPATAVAGTFVPFALQAGDTGIRSIQTLTLGTSYVSGTMHLVAYRPLSKIEALYTGIGTHVDPVTGGFVRLYDDTVPFVLWFPLTTSSNPLQGMVIYAQG